MLKSNMKEAIKLFRFCLLLTSAWPKKNPSILYKMNFFIGVAICFSVYSSFIVEIVKNLNHLVTLAHIIFMTITISSYLCKFFCFLANKGKFLEMIEMLNDPVFYNYPDHLDLVLKRAIKGHLLLKAFFWSSSCVIISYIVYPLLDNQKLPTALSIDFGPYTPIAYVFQIISMTISIVNNMNMDLISLTLVNLAAAQFDILKARIAGVRDEAKILFEDKGGTLNGYIYKNDILECIDDIVCQKLKEIVIHHNRILQ